MPFRPKNSRFWHYDFQIRGRRFHGSCCTEDFEEAKAIEAEARVQARTAPHQRGVFTVSEAIGTYWTDVAQHQPSARTTLSQGKSLVAILGPKTTLPDLTTATLGRFVAVRRATVSNATVNRQLDLMSRAMRHMAARHRAQMPADAIDWPGLALPEPKERIRELTAAEQASLFQHLRADLHPLVSMALMTGARIAALCDLRWRDVDLHEERILFRLKGGGQLRFPINREMRAFLSALPRAEDLPHRSFVLTYLDHSTKEPRRCRITSSGGGLMADFRAALAAAEIHDFHFHDLRHTFATRLLRQTGNLKLVSRLLGHASIESTMRYAHVLDEDLSHALSSYRLQPAKSRRNPRREKN